MKAGIAMVSAAPWLAISGAPRGWPNSRLREDVPSVHDDTRDAVPAAPPHSARETGRPGAIRTTRTDRDTVSARSSIGTSPYPPTALISNAAAISARV